MADIASLPVSDGRKIRQAGRRTRSMLRPLVVAAFFAVAPSYVDEWRLHPAARDAITLEVGEPMVALWSRRR